MPPAAKMPVPPEQYTDVYFLRSKYILEKERLNPFVRAQIFIRKGPGKIFGLEEALTLIRTYSDIAKNGGRIFSLSDGDTYASMETVLLLEGRSLDIITLETMLLGVISAATTRTNDRQEPDSNAITRRTAELVQLLSGRPLYYFGARHWHWSQDATISRAAFQGGASGASTGVGARTVGQAGIGTIPHSLECIFAWKYGTPQTVLQTTLAFDRWMSPGIPRTALVDFANKEIDDSLACAYALRQKLTGVRIDTCGETVMQGARKLDMDGSWFNHGVSVSGVYAVRRALDDAGFSHINIILSGGFGMRERLEAFVHAEEKLNMKLFDAIGVGELFPVRSATMDIVGVGETLNRLEPIAKVGRSYKPNTRLKKVL